MLLSSVDGSVGLSLVRVVREESCTFRSGHDGERVDEEVSAERGEQQRWTKVYRAGRVCGCSVVCS